MKNFYICYRNTISMVRNIKLENTTFSNLLRVDLFCQLIGISAIFVEKSLIKVIVIADPERMGQECTTFCYDGFLPRQIKAYLNLILAQKKS